MTYILDFDERREIEEGIQSGTELMALLRADAWKFRGMEVKIDCVNVKQMSDGTEGWVTLPDRKIRVTILGEPDIHDTNEDLLDANWKVVVHPEDFAALCQANPEVNPNPELQDAYIRACTYTLTKKDQVLKRTFLFKCEIAPELLQQITPANFRTWLEAQDPGAIAGASNLNNTSAVSNFILSLGFRDVSIGDTLDMYVMSLDNQRFDTPDWIICFEEEFDDSFKYLPEPERSESFQPYREWSQELKDRYPDYPSAAVTVAVCLKILEEQTEKWGDEDFWTNPEFKEFEN